MSTVSALETVAETKWNGGAIISVDVARVEATSTRNDGMMEVDR
jgi:hypothetical protein